MKCGLLALMAWCSCTHAASTYTRELELKTSVNRYNPSSKPMTNNFPKVKLTWEVVEGKLKKCIWMSSYETLMMYHHFLWMTKPTQFKVVILKKHLEEIEKKNSSLEKYINRKCSFHHKNCEILENEPDTSSSEHEDLGLESILPHENIAFHLRLMFIDETLFNGRPQKSSEKSESSEESPIKGIIIKKNREENFFFHNPFNPGEPEIEIEKQNLNKAIPGDVVAINRTKQSVVNIQESPFRDIICECEEFKEDSDSIKFKPIRSEFSFEIIVKSVKESKMQAITHNFSDYLYKIRLYPRSIDDNVGGPYQGYLVGSPFHNFYKNMKEPFQLDQLTPDDIQVLKDIDLIPLEFPLEFHSSNDHLKQLKKHFLDACFKDEDDECTLLRYEGLYSSQSDESKLETYLESNREQFDGLDIITIDKGGDKTVADDALHCRFISNHESGQDSVYELGIHIADVSSSISPGSPTDLMASETKVNIYLDTLRRSPNIHSIPISYDILPNHRIVPTLIESGFKTGELRNAISIILKISSSTGDIVDSKVVLSKIIIKAALSFNQVDEFLKNPCNSSDSIKTIPNSSKITLGYLYSLSKLVDTKNSRTNPQNQKEKHRDCRTADLSEKMISKFIKIAQEVFATQLNSFVIKTQIDDSTWKKKIQQSPWLNDEMKGDKSKLFSKTHYELRDSEIKVHTKSNTSQLTHFSSESTHPIRDYRGVIVHRLFLAQTLIKKFLDDFLEKKCKEEKKTFLTDSKELLEFIASLLHSPVWTDKSNIYSYFDKCGKKEKFQFVIEKIFSGRNHDKVGTLRGK